MPKYDQLLLEFGGGVINAKYQSEAYKKAACVAIGIGGTGIAALKRLKKNVYQQLIPDDPEAPDRKSTRLNSSHTRPSRMPSSA